jgi:hypothetical protein
MNEIKTVNIEEAVAAMQVAAKINKPVLLLGDPGIGKTSIVSDVAKENGLKLVTLLGSLIEPTDVGGIPFCVDGSVQRLPLEEIRQAAAEPCLLFLDELTCAPRSVSAAMLRLMLERVAGGTKLHPKTVVFAAANPSEQAPGGIDLSAPMINRMIALTLRPTLTESATWFLGLGRKGSKLRQAGVEIGATALASSDIMQISMPKAREAESGPWGSPRAWHTAALAAAESSGSFDGNAVRTVVEGAVGKSCAAKFYAVKGIRSQLASVEDIINNPLRCDVPESFEASIACCANVAAAAQENSWAAWAFAGRQVHREAKAALRNILDAIGNSDFGLPFESEGKAARKKIVRENARNV